MGDLRHLGSLPNWDENFLEMKNFLNGKNVASQLAQLSPDCEVLQV